MNGRNHLAAGASVMGVLAATSALSLQEQVPRAVAAAGGACAKAWSWAVYGTSILTARGAVLAGACAVLYLAGVVLPDIDSGSSMASRMLGFSLPVRHRGVTHSVWAIGALALASILLWRPFMAMAAGALVHSLCDMLSQAGWVPFYPIGRYKIIHNTVFAKRHWLVLYSSAQPGSESVVVGLLVLACVLVAAFEAYLVLWPAG